MGIRRKIIIGFVSLALLVMGAGGVSLFELTRIEKNTRQILDAGNQTMKISRELLDGAEMQHLSLLHTYSTGNSSAGYDSMFLAGRKMFTDALELGRETRSEAISGIDDAFQNYERLTREYFTGSVDHETDWLRSDYWNAYLNLTTAVKEYMTGTEYDLGRQAENIEENAYRAITPSLVTLGVILLLLFVLLYFIDLYYIKPVVRMSGSLDGWVKYNTPFNPRFEGRDEAFELKENIEELIDRIKRAPKPE